MKKILILFLLVFLVSCEYQGQEDCLRGFAIEFCAAEGLHYQGMKSYSNEEYFYCTERIRKPRSQEDAFRFLSDDYKYCEYLSNRRYMEFNIT